MDITEIIRQARPNVKPQSIRTYVANIKKIAGEKEIENIDFLNNPKEVFSKLEEMKLTMKRNILSSILVLLSAVETESRLYKTYADKLLEMTMEYKRQIDKNEKTETQVKNWVEHSELIAIAKKMIKKNPGSQDALIAALYSYQPPTRLDFYSMEIVGPKDELDSGKNYLVIQSQRTKRFVFNDYKSANKYNTITIPVNKKLNTVINKFLKLNPDRKYLLENKSGLPITRNNLGKKLPVIFKDTGKHVTLNIIRHVYISENIDIPKCKENKDLAKCMMHGQGIQLEYAKN